MSQPLPLTVRAIAQRYVPVRARASTRDRFEPHARARATLKDAGAVHEVSKLTGLKPAVVRQIYYQAFKKAVEDTVDDVVKWLMEYVPTATGQLKRSYIAQIRKSYATETGAYFYLGTKIGYAVFVNAMPPRRIQHRGKVVYAYYGGHHGRLVLNDPKAQHGFNEIVRMQLHTRFEHYLRIRLQQEVAAKWGSGYGIFAKYLRIEVPA